MNTARNLLTTTIYLLLVIPFISPAHAAPYTISADGSEVTDSKTSLIWRRCSEGQTWNGNTCTGTATTFAHEPALAHAQTQTGWRLPSVKELSSIADRSLRNPAIDSTAFPGTFTIHYWSSSPYAGSASNAWYVDFYNGIAVFGSRSETDYVRLVKDIAPSLCGNGICNTGENFLSCPKDCKVKYWVF